MKTDPTHILLDESSDRADRLGMLVSTLCALHCVLVPVLFYLLPTVGTALGDERLEWGLLLLAGLVATLSLGLSYRYHRSMTVLALLTAGLLLLVAARLLEEYGFTVLLSALISVFGATVLIAGHAFNLRQRQASHQPASRDA